MILPKIWSEGQLFAHSSLDGTTLAGDDFPGMTYGKDLGFRFYSKTRRSLVFTGLDPEKLEFTAVTSDYESYLYNGARYRIVFSENHLVTGEYPDSFRPEVYIKGHLKSDGSDCSVQDTKDGDFTALATRGNRFSFAFGHTKKEVLDLAEKGLKCNLDCEEKKKLDFFAAHCNNDSMKYPELYAKCLSVMKTQLYSPEEKFTGIWSTPDRLPHHKLWLWDSVFHSIGFRHIDAGLAEQLLNAVFDHQSEDGFIPHMIGINEKSSITQPPVIAFGALKVYEKSNNKTFLENVLKKNGLFLEWMKNNRKPSGKELYEWKTTNDIKCRCDESGMDNSPRFDIHKPLYAIDFSCFMAADTKAMAQIADILGNSELSSYYSEWHERIKNDVNAFLWSEEDGFYFDLAISDGKFNKVWSVASFLPLYAGVCSDKQAEILVGHLKDTDSFGTVLPIPSISKQDATFGTDMWRGPVWVNFNYLVSEGLGTYGYSDLAFSIMSRTAEVINRIYKDTGIVFEFFDSNDEKLPCDLNRKGAPVVPYDIDVRYQTIRDYGWSVTLTFDFLNSKGIINE